MGKKILKLHQANEDGATDISTQFTPVTIDGSDSSLWVPKDIVTNEEFNTGRTLDGEPIYGMYLKNKELDISNIILIHMSSVTTFGINNDYSLYSGGNNGGGGSCIFIYHYAADRTLLTISIEYAIPSNFSGFIFYKKKTNTN